MPFHSSKVWSDSAPRVNTDVCWPGEPARTGRTPGTVANSSGRSSACRASISCRSMTVAAAGTSSRSAASREALTTMVSLKLGTGSWARAGSPPPRTPARRIGRNRCITCSFRNATPHRMGGARGARASPRPHPAGGVGRCGRSPGFRIVLLPDLPTRATPFRGSTRAVAISGFVPGYSGGGRAGFLPASLSQTRDLSGFGEIGRHRTVWVVKEAPHGGGRENRYCWPSGLLMRSWFSMKRSGTGSSGILPKPEEEPPA